MMEKMLRDPNMQKMLYPYLPEPMRNPESIEWMLNNPEVRKQMEQVFAQSVSTMPPDPDFLCVPAKLASGRSSIAILVQATIVAAAATQLCSKAFC